MRRLLACGVLLPACSCRASEQATEAADTGTSAMEEDTLGSADTLDGGEPDLPGCEPDACMDECGRSYDECINPMVGSCSDADVCICAMSPTCLPCAEQLCGPYEVCGEEFSESEYGECHLPCEYKLEYSWTPEVGCTIPLPRDLPLDVLFFFYLRIEGDEVPRTDSCDDPEVPASFVLDDAALTMTLCGEACPLFESAGQLLTGWAVCGEARSRRSWATRPA